MTKKRNEIFRFTALVLAGAAQCHGSKAEIAEYNGVLIGEAPWKFSQHADKSFLAFKNFEQNSNSALEERDFYTSFNIVPSSNFGSRGGPCNSSGAAINRFLQGLFGATNNSMLVATMSTTITRQHAGQSEFLTDIPLFWIGKNIEFPAKDAQGECFFEVTHTIREPYIIYQGGPFEGYTLDFKIRKYSSLTSHAVKTFKDILVGAGAIFSIANPSSAQITAISNVGDDLEKAINSAQTEGNTISVQKTLSVVPSNLMSEGSKKLVYGILPASNSISNGNVAVYVRVGSSMLLNAISGDLTPEKILANDEVGGKRCLQWRPNPDKDCVTSRQTFRQAYVDTFKTEIGPFFDLGGEGIKKVYGVCFKLRTLASENLQLPTLDALLLRWAATKESGLYEALQDSAQAEKIAVANGISVALLKERCWNEGDTAVFEGVKKELKKLK